MNPVNTYCHLLWDRSYIDEYGNVFFCCLCRPAPIGNIYKNDLAYIWQKSNGAALFRQMSLSGNLPCHLECTVLSREEKEIGLGKFYRHRGEFAKAEISLKDALKGNPKNHVIHYELGWLYKEQKKYAAAKKSFEKALKLNPASHAVYADLGWLYKDQNRFADSQKYFRKALEINPNTESACLGLGWLYKDNGMHNQASGLLRKAARINPDNEVTQALLPGFGGRSTKAAVAKKEFADYPRTLQIMMGTFCPISCIMCPQDHRSGVSINSEVLKKNIDWSRIGDILLQGGEVLAMPEARKLLIWLIDKKHKKIKLVTNGLLINRQWAERLVSGSEWIEISVNAATKKMHEQVNRGSDFDRVIKNIKMLLEVKKATSSKAEIRFHFTIIPKNILEIAQAIRLASKLHCDIITFCYDHPATEYFLNGHREIRNKIREDISKAANDDLGVKIQRNHLGQLGLIKGFRRKPFVDSY